MTSGRKLVDEPPQFDDVLHGWTRAPGEPAGQRRRAEARAAAARFTEPRKRITVRKNARFGAKGVHRADEGTVGAGYHR